MWFKAILVTECSLVIDEKKMSYVLGMLKKHEDLLNRGPHNAKEA
jgi:hypothetical protein